jgi:hypothetical protein
VGYLIFTSVSLPNALVVLMADRGRVLPGKQCCGDPVPLLASMLLPPVLVPAFMGELSSAVWLTVKGVNVAKW